MFNILGILGVSAIVYPFSLMVPESLIQPTLDQAMQIGALTSLVTWTDIGTLVLSLVLLILFAYTGRKLARWEGGVLLAGYLLYIGLSFDLIPTLPGLGG